VAIVHIIMLMCTGLVESFKKVTCKKEVPVQTFEERYEEIHVLYNLYCTYT